MGGAGIPAALSELYAVAKASRENAYSPYSGWKVGAAIRTRDGRIFGGCNVENSSYGATNCAERVAIQSAISDQGPLHLVEVMVVTDASPPWPPCGMCRQVIAEFGDDVVIHAANLKGEIKTARMSELLPNAFKPSHLSKS